MFDKIIFLDVGGYQIYYGNPVEAVVYFKKADHQVNADQGQCLVCGNVNPEIIFNIIEAKIVDDYGNYTKNRKVTPEQWKQLYDKHAMYTRSEDIKELPSFSLSIPSWLKQTKIFATRDLFSKISNKQYLWINLLEAPLLALVLSYIIRYVEIPGTDYIFRTNENIPAFIFMSIIVMLFIGLTVSAEEIFRDQKILKREKFLNLSKSSYLISKIGILFTLSAVQSFLFVLIGNSIVGISGMYWDYWWMLFTVSCFANLLGLNISASFNSAVTIYILIPIIVIPQMILGGAMFSFDKLNDSIGGGKQVPPMIAEVMVSRWAYEGLMVDQFKNNPLEREVFDFDQKESMCSYKQAFFIPKLQEYADECISIIGVKKDSVVDVMKDRLWVIRKSLESEKKLVPRVAIEDIEKFNFNEFNEAEGERLKGILEELMNYYTEIFNVVNGKKMVFLAKLQDTQSKQKAFVQAKDDYLNDYLTEIVTKSTEKDKISIQDHQIIQKKDPIFMDANTERTFSFRTHFFAPTKNLFGTLIGTYGFNILIIWCFTALLYTLLYFDGLKKVMNLVGKKN